MMTAQEPSRQITFDRKTNRAIQTGILLLSSTLKVLYLNPEARAFLQEMIQRSRPAVDLPPEIRSFCEGLLQMLPTSPGPSDWEVLCLSRIIAFPTHSILLRGFGVPIPSASGEGQLLLLIEPAQRTDHVLNSEAGSSDQIQLTPRERSVTLYLLEGFTNKEIANKLSISEHTVKDHLKRLMKKTQTTTRTAVVSRLLSRRDLVARLSHTSSQLPDPELHGLAV